MSLPSPNLDDRKFQDIVDQSKRAIGLRCPEWTDHNVSDPGVTLIELFSSMTEMILYRLNQVPEKNYVKFLEMLGLTLGAPQPAKTDLQFRLTKSIPGSLDGEEKLTIPARTVVGTLRTEFEDGIEFTTDRDLNLVQPQLETILRIAADPSEKSPVVFEPERNEPFRIFGQVPKQGDCVYFGFKNNVGANLLRLDFTCVEPAPDGLTEEYPSHVWECWTAEQDRWVRLDVSDSTTKGFSQDGTVEIEAPPMMWEKTVGDVRGYWFRCRYTYSNVDLPSRGPDKPGPTQYKSSPRIVAAVASTIGGTVSASNCVCVQHEVLGQSDGLPGQTFRLRFAPLLQLRHGENLAIGAIADDASEMDKWPAWTEVEDFSLSGPEDRHFVCDYLTGEIRFGPNIVKPDGSSRQHGAIPDQGLTVGLTGYRYGGGTGGNIRENKLRVLKSSVKYVSSVTNPKIAAGGKDREDLEHAKLRAREILQVRDRAVTADDYECLALRATSEIGRARCLQPGETNDPLKAGLVKVLLIPTLSPEVSLPRPVDLVVSDRAKGEVRSYLNDRRLLTSRLEVDEPKYVSITVHLEIMVDPKFDPDQVVQRLRESLNRYLHPLFGGPNGQGWPFKRKLTMADIYARVGEVRGVNFLTKADVMSARVLDLGTNRLGPQTEVNKRKGLVLEDDQLLCSGDHRIQIVDVAGGDEQED